jgi:ATP-dependent Lhr-like helicase
MLAEQGEFTVQSRSFFAVFESAEEWRLVVGQRTLGTLPISTPVHKDGLVVFAGQRWIILDIDEKTNTLFVASHPGGKVPKFDGVNSERLHDRLVAEMRTVFASSDIPDYLDMKATSSLGEGRQLYHDLLLNERVLVPEDRNTHVFLWRGSQATAVLSAALARAGLKCAMHDLGLTIAGASVVDVSAALDGLSKADTLSSEELARSVANIKTGKFREMVSDGIARLLWAKQNQILINEIPAIAKKLTASAPG